jgi:uncharacterized protein YdiU (UPF0061 family)
MKFEYSYLSLPATFYQLEKLAVFSKTEIVLLNNNLMEALNIPITNEADVISFLAGNNFDEPFSPFAQAYAGHQFGHFTKLGDGRAIVMGEYLTQSNKRFDIQLKGSGRTVYSRGGDGKATLKAMLREYLISEAMYHLNIPTSRSLFVAKTGDLVQREKMHEGAVVARLMKSHVRVGTFEYARHFGTNEDLNALCNYAVKRLYPEIEKEENAALELLKNVMIHQIDLVVNWMRVGFIHGVMNTDNVSISGETFDYGPCAFMNAYHPDTVFSSIDQHGRYAFGNQPAITKWNIARFAEALLPIIHLDKEKSLELAQSVIDEFDVRWNIKYYHMMLNKIGIESEDPALYNLVDELLGLMKTFGLDYTNTFLSLSKDINSNDSLINIFEFKSWLEKWNKVIVELGGMEQAKKLMHKYNPIIIPRNHLVEQALDEGVNGNMNYFLKFVDILSKPYQDQDDVEKFMEPSDVVFESSYQTFCGT